MSKDSIPAFIETNIHTHTQRERERKTGREERIEFENENEKKETIKKPINSSYHSF